MHPLTSHMETLGSTWMIEGWDCLSWNKMEVSVSFTPIPTGQEPEWILQPVLAWQKTENSLLLPEIKPFTSHYTV